MSSCSQQVEDRLGLPVGEVVAVLHRDDGRDRPGLASWSSRRSTDPMWRILPSSFSSASAPIDSARGTSGSGRWNW